LKPPIRLLKISAAQIMELEKIIETLRQPSAYPDPVGSIEVFQTHISVVFLAGDFAYKIKKPISLGFLDYSTLEKRLHFCREEVRLNRRLSPDVYLEVVPILHQYGSLVIEERSTNDPESRSRNNIKEYAVKMKRLPPGCTFRALLERGELEEDLLDRLAAKLVDFYSEADFGEEISKVGSWPVVSDNSKENFEQIRPFIGQTLSRQVFNRLHEQTEEALKNLRTLIERRSRGYIPRDTHGDLRLEHIYFFPNAEEQMQIIVVDDCIEFNKRFRYADPVADVAFLAMDLEHEGYPQLSRKFSDAYFKKADDAQGRKLLPFYILYRHMVRGKVSGIKSAEKSVQKEKREKAHNKARRHFLSALGKLSLPMEKPCLVLVGGLPGVGKSTLARQLEDKAGFVRISSDSFRKKLAGLPETADAGADFSEGIYTAEWTGKTYGQLLIKAGEMLFQGRRVVVDASFPRNKYRIEFLDMARNLGISGLFFICEADHQVVRDRLEARKNDVSDANWDIYLKATDQWETPSDEIMSRVSAVFTNGTPDESLSASLRLLHQKDLY